MGKLLRIYELDNGSLSITKLGNLTNLVCDEETRVIYYKFSETDARACRSYFGSYISKNGKYCRFIKGKILEID